MTDSTPLWQPAGPPAIIDLSHHNADPRLDDGEIYHAFRDAGVRLVILKASQGVSFRDPKYAPRRHLATAAGLKVDAYHFLDGSAVSTQIAHFLAAAEPDAGMRLALDCEPNAGAAAGSVAPFYANRAAALLDAKLGRQCLRYTGAGYVTPQRVKLLPDLLNGPIWLAKYGPAPTAAWLLALGIDPLDVVLWQFTDRGTVAELRPVDCSYFIGPLAALEQWPLLPRFDKPAAAAVQGTNDAPAATTVAATPRSSP